MPLLTRSVRGHAGQKVLLRLPRESARAGRGRGRRAKEAGTHWGWRSWKNSSVAKEVGRATQGALDLD